MPIVDELTLQINAKADSANSALDRLITKLDRLTVSLEKANGNAINSLASGIERLGKSMQVVNSVSATDFTRLTRNIERLSVLNTASINSTASSISILSKSVDSLSTVSKKAQQIGTLSSNLAKLGYKGIATAVHNIPLLSNELKKMMATLSTAPQVSNNIIQMTNALANLASQLNNVKTTSTGTFDNLSSGMKKATSSTFSLAAAFGKFYASYFLVVRAIKGLWQSIESTTDYIESFNYQTVALGKIASDWEHEYVKYGKENAEAYAKSFNERFEKEITKLTGLRYDDEQMRLVSEDVKNLGLNIQEVTQYASQLASVMNSVGMTGEATVTTSIALTKLAGDLSSLFNIDYETAAQNIQSGLIGQSRALTYIAHKRSNTFKKTSLISGNSCNNKTIRSEAFLKERSTTIEMVA